MQSLRQMLAQSANRPVGCPHRPAPGSTTPGHLLVSGPNRKQHHPRRGGGQAVALAAKRPAPHPADLSL